MKRGDSITYPTVKNKSSIFFTRFFEHCIPETFSFYAKLNIKQFISAKRSQIVYSWRWRIIFCHKCIHTHWTNGFYSISDIYLHVVFSIPILIHWLKSIRHYYFYFNIRYLKLSYFISRTGDGIQNLYFADITLLILCTYFQPLRFDLYRNFNFTLEWIWTF